MRLFELLVESGSVYCLLWILVVAYAFTSTFGGGGASGWRTLAFYLTNGCLIPIVVRPRRPCFTLDVTGIEGLMRDGVHRRSTRC